MENLKRVCFKGETNSFLYLAEKEGFEPSVEFYPHTRLAGEHHRPLGHLSVFISLFLAEEVGFEPTVLSYNGFQDRRLKPLGHSSSATYVPLETMYVNSMLTKNNQQANIKTFL